MCTILSCDGCVYFHKIQTCKVETLCVSECERAKVICEFIRSLFTRKQTILCVRNRFFSLLFRTNMYIFFLFPSLKRFFLYILYILDREDVSLKIPNEKISTFNGFPCFDQRIFRRFSIHMILILRLKFHYPFPFPCCRLTPFVYLCI